MNNFFFFFFESLRLYHSCVRQGALHCLLAVVKRVEKRTLYGYWTSFIPDSTVGRPSPLSLLTVILKDTSAKVHHTLTVVSVLLGTCGCSTRLFFFPLQVRACALQVLSAMLDGSRQFLAVAEDTASPRTSYTPFSFLLATAVRELHRALSLALLAETSPQTLTQVIKVKFC